MNYSKSTDQQDLWVATNTNFKRNGFFVEIGGADGIKTSNTYFLEKFLGWKGILAEPAIKYHQELRNNRPECFIDFNCVWSTTGEEKTFYESVWENDFRSIVEDCTRSWMTVNRKKWPTYTVKTISLLDLLDKHNAPRCIDYLSLDTEGSEFTILQSFDFSKYTFNYITIEHNLHPKYRNKIKTLLNQNGYYTPDDSIDIFKWDDGYCYRP